MQKLKLFFTWLCGRFAHNGSNVYSIVFFALVIVVVLANSMTNERKSTLRAIVLDDLEEANNSQELYHKIIGLIRGDAQKARTSLFSFKQIQYSLENRDYFTKINGFVGVTNSNAATYLDKYYFKAGDNIVMIKVKDPLKPIVNKINPAILDRGNLFDFERGIQFFWYSPTGSPRPGLLEALRAAKPDSNVEVFRDIELVPHYVRADSALKELAKRSDWRFLHSGAYLFFISDSQNVFSYTPIDAYENGDNDDNGDGDGVSHLMTQKAKINGLDVVLTVSYIPMLNKFYIHGKKDKKELNFLLSPYDSVPESVSKNEYISFRGSSDFMIKDDAGNFIFNIYRGVKNKGDTLFKTVIRQRQIDFDSTFVWQLFRLGYSSTGDIWSFLPVKGENFQSFAMARIFKSVKDSMDIEKVSNFNIRQRTVVFKDLFLCDSNGHAGVTPHYFTPGIAKMGFDDSVLFRLIAENLVLTPNFNQEGIMLLKLDDFEDFVVLRREGNNTIKAAFTPDSLNFAHLDFDYSVTYDIYYIVIFICTVVVIYFFGLTLVNQAQTSRYFDADDLPKLDSPSLDYKLNMTYITMEALRKRSEVMLRLGIAFGIVGVLVSAIVFKVSDLNLGPAWQDPHTLLNILKPLIILLFMETFTFYFLKQYRIIFNEYKLFYSIFVDLLGTNSLIELDKIPALKADTLKLLRDKMARPRYHMYETDTREKIDEFAHGSILDIANDLKTAKRNGVGSD
jgi:hypothetical protein